MQHFITSISPFSPQDSNIDWSSSNGSKGRTCESLASALKTALNSSGATLGVSIFDDLNHELKAQNVSKGFRLVQEGSTILSDVIRPLRDDEKCRIFVGAEYFEDVPSSLLLWQVRRDLSAPSVQFSTQDWAERAYNMMDEGLKNATLTTMIDKSSPICVVGGALYKSDWAGKLDFSENMVVLEV